MHCHPLTRSQTHAFSAPARCPYFCLLCVPSPSFATIVLGGDNYLDYSDFLNYSPSDDARAVGFALMAVPGYAI